MGWIGCVPRVLSLSIGAPHLPYFAVFDFHKNISELYMIQHIEFRRNKVLDSALLSRDH